MVAMGVVSSPIDHRLAATRVLQQEVHLEILPSAANLRPCPDLVTIQDTE